MDVHFQILDTVFYVQAFMLGFAQIFGELSSEATQHVVFNKLGHTEVAGVSFNEFSFRGQTPFASIEKPERIIRAEGML